MIDLERILTNIFNVINFARVPNCLDGKVLSNMLMSAKIPSYYFFRYSIKYGHPSHESPAMTQARQTICDSRGKRMRKIGIKTSSVFIGTFLVLIVTFWYLIKTQLLLNNLQVVFSCRHSECILACLLSRYMQYVTYCVIQCVSHLTSIATSSRIGTVLKAKNILKIRPRNSHYVN